MYHGAVRAEDKGAHAAFAVAERVQEAAAAYGKARQVPGAEDGEIGVAGIQNVAARRRNVRQLACGADAEGADPVVGESADIEVGTACHIRECHTESTGDCQSPRIEDIRCIDESYAQG